MVSGWLAPGATTYAVTGVLPRPAVRIVCTMSADNAGPGSLAVAVAVMMTLTDAVAALCWRVTATRAAPTSATTTTQRRRPRRRVR